MKEKIIQYWHELQPREQKLLMGSAAGLILIALFLMFDTFSKRNTEIKQKLQNEEELLVWMQPVVEQIVITRSQVGGEPVTTSNILAQVETSLSEAGLSGDLVTLDLVAANQVQLVFNNVVYEALIDWLFAFSHQGVIVQEFTVTKVEEIGAVNANIMLSAAGV